MKKEKHNRVTTEDVKNFFAKNEAWVKSELNKPDPLLPLVKDNQTVSEFITEQTQVIVQEKLKAKLVEMFSKPKPVSSEKVGDDLYICDTIYDAYENDENKGKSALLIAQTVQNKIRDYLRINSDYEYINSEYNFFPGGQMRLVFHFTKLKLKVWDL